MTAPLTLTPESHLAEIERASHLVEKFGERRELPARVVIRIYLAREGSLTNVLWSQHEDGAEHDVAVRLSPAEPHRWSRSRPAGRRSLLRRLPGRASARGREIDPSEVSACARFARG